MLKWLLLAWLGGAGSVGFMVVADEVHALALACGYACKYPFPLIGAYENWDAWTMAFSASVFSFVLSLLAIGMGVRKFHLERLRRAAG